MTVPVIVLAGERPGGNALAQAFGEPSGVLVKVAGRPCVSHVLDCLAGSSQVDGGVIVGPARKVAESSAMQAILASSLLRWVAPASGPAESALVALEQVDAPPPVLLTSADHALLTPAIVDTFCAQALAIDADFVAGLVPYARVKATFPQSKRTLLKFSDGTYCGSNLFLIRSEAGIRALELWRTVQSHRKQPWRMARQIGITTMLAYLLGRLSLHTAVARLSSLAGCRIAALSVEDARAAVDVDSPADHKLAEHILSQC